MYTDKVNGCHIKVWSMSLMGWRYAVSFPDGTTKAATKRSEVAAKRAAFKLAREHSDVDEGDSNV